ncbi:hypothetical protein VKT23_012872 [Stygiomarasmius scandens]|uniref:Uncharacterized protein n=1 Tax=Marasmiellus scandens TaxID=2682957 RepID=A0ABR1JA05_9AGAR
MQSRSIWTGTSYDGVPGCSNPNAAATAAGVAAGGGGSLFRGMGQLKVLFLKKVKEE